MPSSRDLARMSCPGVDPAPRRAAPARRGSCGLDPGLVRDLRQVVYHGKIQVGLNRGPLGLWPDICPRVAEVTTPTSREDFWRCAWGDVACLHTGTPVSPYAPRHPPPAPSSKLPLLGEGSWEPPKSGMAPFFSHAKHEPGKNGGHRGRRAGFSGVVEAQFRIQPFIMERKRTWLGAMPRAGSWVPLAGQGSVLPRRGACHAPVFKPRLKARDFELSRHL